MFDEHFIQLLVASSRRLGVAEKEIDRAEDGKASKDEGRFGAEVGLVGVKDVRNNERPHGLFRSVSSILGEKRTNSALTKSPF